MKDRLKSGLLTILILVIITILLFFNYYYYKLSPTMLYNAEDRGVLELFEESNNLNNLTLESRYAHDKIYYSAVDSKNLYFFAVDGKLLLKIDSIDLDYSKAKSIAKTMFNDLESKVSLSLYKGKPVYVIVNKDFDVFIDFYDLKEVFRYRKGIANE